MMECGWVGERRGERGEVRGRLRWEGGKEGERGEVGRRWRRRELVRLLSARFSFNARPTLRARRGKFGATAPSGNPDGSSFQRCESCDVKSLKTRRYRGEW